MAKILVLHGAGMNMRGKVQVDLFGPMQLPDYDRLIREYAQELGVEVEIFHSNVEGEVINRIYAAEAKKHPGVQFISTWMLFADKKGSYSEALSASGGELVLMRAPDGIHLTRAGGDRMAQVVLDVIEKDWGIPQQP